MSRLDQLHRLGSLVFGGLTAPREEVAAVLSGDPEAVERVAERGDEVLAEVQSRASRIAGAKGPARKVLNAGHKVHIAEIIEPDEDDRRAGRGRR